MSERFEIHNGFYGIQCYDHHGEPGPFFAKGHMVSIRAYYTSLETSHISYSLEFPTKIGTIGRCDITAFDLLGKQGVDEELVNKGADIMRENLVIFRACFRELEDQKDYPVINTYRYVGFLSSSDTEASLPAPDTYSFNESIDTNTVADSGEVLLDESDYYVTDCNSESICIESNSPTDCDSALPDESAVCVNDNFTVSDSSESASQEIIMYRSINLILPPGMTDIEAEYKGNLHLQKYGTAAESFAFYRREVVPYPKLLIAFLAGACAVTTGIIGNTRPFCNPIFHLYGQSSSGKSCAAKVAASIFGKPFETSECNGEMIYTSVYGSWAGTENGIRDYCAGNRGMAIILNELGKSKVRDMTQLLYDLSEGTSKKRSSGDGTVRQRDGYRTSFISTGEFSIFEKVEVTFEGLLYRVMEIEAPFTADAAHAKRLEEGCLQNCGHGAEILAAYILANGSRDMVTQIYDKYYIALNTKVTNHSALADRFISTFAAPLLTTAELVNAAWDLGIDLDIVESFLMDYLNAKESTGDLPWENFKKVVEICQRNLLYFSKEGVLGHVRDTDFKGEWGIIEYLKASDGTVYFKLWLYPTKLDEICKENNLPSAKQCMKIWKARGWTDSESDRLINRTRGKVPFYVLVVKHIEPDVQVVNKLDKEKCKIHDEILEDNPPEDHKTVNSFSKTFSKNTADKN